MDDWKEKVKKGLSKKHEIGMIWFIEHIKVEITPYEKELFRYFRGHDEEGFGEGETLPLKEVLFAIDCLVEKPDILFIDGKEV